MFMVDRGGWLPEREEHRASALNCYEIMVAREGWLIEREEHRARSVSVVCMPASGETRWRDW